MFLATLAALIAQADNPGEQIGNNVRDLILGFIGPVFLAGVACAAAALLGIRKASQFVLLAIAVIVIGIPIFNSDGVQNLIESIGDSVTRGV